MNSTGRANPATKVPERSGTKVLCGRTYSISTRLFFSCYSLTIVITDSQPSKAGLGLVPQAQRNCQRGSDPRSSIILDSLVSPPGSQGSGEIFALVRKSGKSAIIGHGKPCSFTNPLRAFEEKVSCKSKIQTKASWQCYAFLGLFHILNDLVPRFFRKATDANPLHTTIPTRIARSLKSEKSSRTSETGKIH